MFTIKSRCEVVSAFFLYTVLMFTTFSATALSFYSEDFESLDQFSETALGDAGWVVFGNVFDPGGTYLYGYGVFPAPNGVGAFSNIASGEGGATQGEQQLVVFSDYNNNDEHSGGNLVESNVFQEQVIEAADVGSTWLFTFDAKAGDLWGSSTALAFIKTVDPGADFALTNFLALDTTNLSALWDTYSLTLFIDSGLVGQLLQFGFLNTATNFEPSGVLYDNVSFSPVPLPGAVWLLLSGIAGLVGIRRNKR